MAEEPPTLRAGQALVVEAYRNSEAHVFIIRGKEAVGKTFVANWLLRFGEATRVEDRDLSGFPPSPGERIIVTMRERGPLYLAAGCVSYLIDEDTCVIDPDAIVTDMQMGE